MSTGCVAHGVPRVYAARMAVEKTAEQQIGPWTVWMKWDDEADQGGPMRLVIEPSDDAIPEQISGGISSTVLRQVNFREAAEQWRRETPGTVLEEYFRERLKELLQNEGVSEKYLAYLASVYVGMVKAGERGITSKLADAIGRRPDTIKAHLKAARKHELLTVIPGTAGGQLTDKAKDILKESQ